MHEVVEARAALEEIVETAHDGEDAKGENPDTNNGNNAGLLANEPAKDTEEGGDDVDDQDGTAELPRGDGRPEGAVGAGDEDEPVLGEGDLEEDDLVDVTKVLDDTAVLATGVHGGERNPGADGEDGTEEDGHAPELGEVPLDGGLGVGGVVVGDGQGGDVGEDGNEDDQLNVERLVEDGNPETQEDLHVQGQGDTVDDVGVHAVEDLTGGLESVNDGAEARGKEDNVGGGAGGIGGTLDGNASVGLLQRGSVVDTVTSHGNEVATLLENLDDGVLVLGENLGEAIGSLDEIVDLGAGHVAAAAETETLGVVDVGAEAELARSLTSDADGITGQHLDGQAEVLGFVDGAGGVVAGGVGARHYAEDLPGTLAALAGNAEGTETAGGKLGDAVLVGLVNVLGDGVVLLDGLENEERGALDTGDALALGRLDNGGDLLGDGVEGVELNDLVLGQDALGTGVVLERLEESLVNGVDALLLAGGGQAGGEHEVVGIDTLDGVGLGERELVLGQSAGLVGAENLDTSQGLDGRELLNNGLLLGEVGGADSHGGGDDGGKTDGDTDDGDGQSEAQDGDDAVGSVEGGDPDDEQGQDDEDEENRADAVEHLGEVTSATSGLRDEGSGTTDEGAVTGSGDDHEGLTTLDSRGSIALVALVLVDSERLAGDGGLVDLEESALGDDATIGGDDGTLLNLQNITRDDFGGLNLLQGTVTEDNSLESESLFEFFDDGTSLEFLDETDTGVEQEETQNDTEIDPILETSSQNSSSL
ncbi:hypothetical protein Trco_004423 [Trichoderma cornu-damae]|uniref:Uncharacterized protein n=1 Tax=Trichoderma cornu-damae TaxID=654480 RepID=A0A9P8QMH7_9HYPO|nr:hypothetical protein Trco_004423 [Trichoderma cornu-damae]